MIYILTGNIRSGKTTSIKSWASQNKNIGGFITPDATDGRVIENLHSGEVFPFESDAESSELTIAVGKFHFLKSGFEKGEEICMLHLKDENIDTIVIDEIGKLELKDKGFSNLLSNLLKSDLQKDLVLVVRSALFDAVVKHYLISEHQLIDTEFLNSKKPE